MGSDDTKKELRASLTPIENFFMLLMVGSQVCGYAMIVAYHDSDFLRQGLYRLALFHTLWAVRNFVTDRPQERGMITYGCVAGGCFLKREMLAIIGAVLVWASFLFVFSKVGSWPLGKLAHVSKKTLLWAKVYSFYLYSNLIIWLAIGGLLVYRKQSGMEW